MTAEKRKPTSSLTEGLCEVPPAKRVSLDMARAAASTMGSGTGGVPNMYCPMPCGLPMVPPFPMPFPPPPFCFPMMPPPMMFQAFWMQQMAMAAMKHQQDHSQLYGTSSLCTSKQYEPQQLKTGEDCLDSKERVWGAATSTKDTPDAAAPTDVSCTGYRTAGVSWLETSSSIDHQMISPQSSEDSDGELASFIDSILGNEQLSLANDLGFDDLLGAGEDTKAQGLKLSKSESLLDLLEKEIASDYTLTSASLLASP